MTNLAGYQYRLCPKSQPLSEECFQAHPLPFADGTSALRWGGPAATKRCAKGEYADCVLPFAGARPAETREPLGGGALPACPTPRRRLPGGRPCGASF